MPEFMQSSNQAKPSRTAAAPRQSRQTSTGEQGKPSGGARIVINAAYDVRPLAAAVILQALRDAAAGNDEARAWLEGDGLAWLELFDYFPERRRMAKAIKKSIRLLSKQAGGQSKLQKTLDRPSPNGLARVSAKLEENDFLP